MYQHFPLFKTTGTLNWLPAANTDFYPDWGDNMQVPIFSRSLYEISEFGFFPKSLKWWADGDGFSWVMGPDGKAIGWVNGMELGDAADGSGMLFENKTGEVVEITAENEMAGKRRFVLKGEKAMPAWLADANHLGFFEVSGSVVIAKW
jgi:hypothetical protein